MRTSLSARHCRGPLRARLTDEDGHVRVIERQATITVRGHLGQITVTTPEAKVWCAISFNPNDRALRARLIDAILDHLAESEERANPNG